MRERESAALLSGGLCFAFAVLRMVAPAVPFDGMTLALVLFAALSLLAPAYLREKPPLQNGHAEPQAQEKQRLQLATLSKAMEQVTWQAKSGGLFDALLSLYQENPFSALCALRGMLAMLGGKAKPAEQDLLTLAQLTKAIDQVAQQGEKSAHAQDVEVLFSYGIRALSMLDSL